MIDWLMIAAGLVLLFAGGESLVRGAVGLSRRFGISELAIGLTVVGFGTSMPELLVSVDAAFSGSPGIALGNVIGSNTANILLILGLSALITPVMGWTNTIRRDVAVMCGVALLALALGLTGSIGRIQGAMMVAALVVYLVWTFRMSRNDPQAAEHVAETHSVLWLVAFLIGGLAALFGGASLLVDGATSIARNLGVPEAIIGLTIVAVGTSLPELATSLVAAYRGNSAVAIGNVVGSNVFNILGILGLTTVIAPMAVDPSMARFDIPFMVAMSFVLAGLLFFTTRLSRPVGGTMLAVYVAYTAYLFAA